MKTFDSASGSAANRPILGASIEDTDPAHAIEAVRRCFTESIKPNFWNAIEHGAPIAAAMVALAAVDFLASHYCGQDRGTEGYQAFVREYILPLAPARAGGCDPKILYRNLRSGLFHNYTTSKTPTRHRQQSDLTYVLTDNPRHADRHLTVAEGAHRRVLFHIQTFFEHVVRAQDRYFQDLETDLRLRDRFVTWYQESTRVSDFDISCVIRNE
jgi:hypothetical protein